MFSFHANRTDIGKPWKYNSNWQIYLDDSIHNVAHMITRYVTSPCAWASGCRKTERFQFADWLVLDFDEGKTIAEIAAIIGKFTHVIGTTKSHQKVKGEKPACDRFRLWLRLDQRITDAVMFQRISKGIAKKLGADLQAVDAARMYMPSREVVSALSEGLTVPVQLMIREDDKAREREKVSAKPAIGGSYMGKIPYYVRDWLDGKTDALSRNMLSFRIGAILTKNGFSESDIVDIIMGSRLPVDQSERVRREVAQAVRSGARQ